MFGSAPEYRTKSSRMLAELIDKVPPLNDSAQATSTPSPEPVHDSSVPEIDGSHAAFIGLMVGLSAIILICCGLVYYLLRTRPRDDDTARGLYKSAKDSETKGQWNNEFDPDSEDEDVEKQHPRRDREKADGKADGNGLSAGQTQENTRYDGDDDSFDPDKIRASVPKSGSSAAPAQSAL